MDEIKIINLNIQTLRAHDFRGSQCFFVLDSVVIEGFYKFIIYENIKSDTTFAQTASQLVSIFVNANILEYNGKKRNMEFWLVDEEWEKALIKC